MKKKTANLIMVLLLLFLNMEYTLIAIQLVHHV